MSVALHGNLRDFGIAEVFQLIGQQRKTGTLVVGDEEDAIFLAFDAGCVVRGGPASSRTDREPLGPQLVRSGYLTRAQLDDLRVESERSARPLTDLLLATGLIEPGTLEEVQHLLTRETVFDVMRRKSGDFKFTAERIDHDTKPENLLGAEQILMDGLRMLDEWQTFADIVPSEDTVFARAGNLEAALALTKGDADARLGHAERVLQLVDGRLSVRRIIDLSRIGTFEATRALAELRQAGVIDVATTSAKPARAPRAARPRQPILPLLRAALAIAIPIAALSLLALVTHDRAVGDTGIPGSALPTRAAAVFGERQELETLRTLIEIHFFEHGRYPDRLALLDADIAARFASLTPERLADYYYRVGEDEVVLLPPTRGD